jgi:hypothetical protein
MNTMKIESVPAPKRTVTVSAKLARAIANSQERTGNVLVRKAEVGPQHFDYFGWLKRLRKALHDERLTPLTFVVAVVASHYGDYTTGTRIRPGIPLLVEVTQISARTIGDALKTLEKEGFFRMVKRGYGNGTIRPASEYELVP